MADDFLSIDTSEVDIYLKSISDPAVARRGVREGLRGGMLEVRNRVVENLSNKILKRQTGKLVGSVFPHGLDDPVREEGDSFVGVFGSRGVPYARIHEFGGTIPAHFVKPVEKQALKFRAGKGMSGEVRFSKGHMIPEIRMPERMPFRKAARGELGNISKRIAAQTALILKNAGKQ
jgi:hypothetical protein